MVGGAKGVGKTSLTTIVSLDLGLARIETGRLLTEYFKDKPSIDFKEYVTQRILDNERDLVLDTHFAQYSPYAEENMPFERALNQENLFGLAGKFDISLCLLKLNPEELLKRRLNDTKRRVIVPKLILEELAFNQRASEIYSAELDKPVFRLENNDFIQTKLQIEEWITLLSRSK